MYSRILDKQPLQFEEHPQFNTTISSLRNSWKPTCWLGWIHHAVDHDHDLDGMFVCLFHCLTSSWLRRAESRRIDGIISDLLSWLRQILPTVWSSSWSWCWYLQCSQHHNYTHNVFLSHFCDLHIQVFHTLHDLDTSIYNVVSIITTGIMWFAKSCIYRFSIHWSCSWSWWHSQQPTWLTQSRIGLP